MNKWLFVFLVFLSLNLHNSFLKSQNGIGSRKIFKRFVSGFPIIHDVRFKDEQLSLQGNQEIFLQTPSSRTFTLTADIKLSQEGLIYIFFHLRKPVNRTGYAFRISALPGAPSAFLKYDNSHVISKKLLSYKSGLFPSGKWMKLILKSEKGMHVLYINNRAILKIYDTRYDSGITSIAAEMRPVTLDNLTIKSGSWTYQDDFSARTNNQHYPIVWSIKFFFFFFSGAFILMTLFRWWMKAPDENKQIYFGHLRVQILLLVPGALLMKYDTLCFTGTFAAILLFFGHTLKLFIHTNTIFLPNYNPSKMLSTPHRSPKKFLFVLCTLTAILFLLHIFLSMESLVRCSLETCPKKLLLEKPTLSFFKNPVFLDNSLNIRNPALSFKIYGKEGTALLIIFNKVYDEVLTLNERDSYSMLLSFHKTLPTLLLRGHRVLKSAASTPFLKNKWNKIEIISSGKHITFFLNGKQILSYHSRKLFSGGIKILPIYKIPRIQNFYIYRLETETLPFVFDIMDILFFMLRMVTFLFLILYVSFAALSLSHFMSLRFYLKRAIALFIFPVTLWLCIEVLPHFDTTKGGFPFYIFQFLGSLLMVISFFFLHFFICKRINLFSLKRKILLILLTILFFEGFCVSASPYMETLQKPWYAFVHDKNHFWYFDPSVRFPNGYFSLNRARYKRYPYPKQGKKRIFVLGSSSAYGQSFKGASPYIFSSQLEKRLRLKHVEVLNFAFPASTSFTGLMFLKGIYPLFKPDIILWNYSQNDALFLKGTLQRYDFLQALYTDRKLFLHRIFYTSYTFHAFLNFMDSTGIQALLYLPRRSTKRMLYEKNLEVLSKFCKTNKIQLVLVHETSDETLWQRYKGRRKKLWDPKDKLFYDIFTTFSKKHHAFYIFTIPELIKHREDRLYLDSVHYSKAGHDVMADILYEFLIKNKLVR